jgi:hypothetical protein
MVPEIYVKNREESINKSMTNIHNDMKGMSEKNDTTLRSSFRRIPTVLNRTIAVKDTFISIQPSYGVIADELVSEN